jgi:hypothetical protein
MKVKLQTNIIHQILSGKVYSSYIWMNTSTIRVSIRLYVVYTCMSIVEYKSSTKMMNDFVYGYNDSGWQLS